MLDRVLHHVASTGALQNRSPLCHAKKCDVVAQQKGFVAATVAASVSQDVVFTGVRGINVVWG